MRILTETNAIHETLRDLAGPCAPVHVQYIRADGTPEYHDVLLDMDRDLVKLLPLQFYGLRDCGCIDISFNWDQVPCIYLHNDKAYITVQEYLRARIA